MDPGAEKAIVFDLIHSLDFEARQALFAAVMDVHSSGRREVLVQDLLVGILRTRSITNELSPSTNLSGLIEKLGGPPLGQGTHDASARLDEQDTSEEGQTADAFGAVASPQAGRFLALPLSTHATRVFESLRQDFQGTPAKSVTPKQMITSLLRVDPELRSICAEFGLHGDALG